MAVQISLFISDMIKMYSTTPTKEKCTDLVEKSIQISGFSEHLWFPPFFFFIKFDIFDTILYYRLLT